MLLKCCVLGFLFQLYFFSYSCYRYHGHHRTWTLCFLHVLRGLCRKYPNNGSRERCQGGEMLSIGTDTSFESQFCIRSYFEHWGPIDLRRKIKQNCNRYMLQTEQKWMARGTTTALGKIRICNDKHRFNHFYQWWVYRWALSKWPSPIQKWVMATIEFDAKEGDTALPCSNQRHPSAQHRRVWRKRRTWRCK